MLVCRILVNYTCEERASVIRKVASSCHKQLMQLLRWWLNLISIMLKFCRKVHKTARQEPWRKNLSDTLLAFKSAVFMEHRAWNIGESLLLWKASTSQKLWVSILLEPGRLNLAHQLSEERTHISFIVWRDIGNKPSRHFDRALQAERLMLYVANLGESPFHLKCLLSSAKALALCPVCPANGPIQTVGCEGYGTSSCTPWNHLHKYVCSSKDTEWAPKEHSSAFTRTYIDCKVPNDLIKSPSISQTMDSEAWLFLELISVNMKALRWIHRLQLHISNTW